MAVNRCRRGAVEGVAERLDGAIVQCATEGSLEPGVSDIAFRARRTGQSLLGPAVPIGLLRSRTAGIPWKDSRIGDYLHVWVGLRR